MVDGKLSFLDVKSLIINDRIMVPIRFIAETFGYRVSWEQATHRIHIDSTGVEPQQVTELPTVGSARALAELLKYSDRLNNYVSSRFSWDDLVRTNDMDAEGGMTDAPAEAEIQESASEESAKASDDFSDTNVQTEGVEEGDIIKTDGRNIYYTRGNEVLVISSDTTKPEILSVIEIESSRGRVSELYIHDGLLTVMGSSHAYYAYPVPLMEEVEPLEMVQSKMVMPYYNTNNTFLLVYDVSNPKKPVLKMDMDFEGLYKTSRMVEDKLYMVTNRNLDYYGIHRMYIDGLHELEDGELIDYSLKPKYSDNMTGSITMIPFEEIRYFPDYIRPNYLMTIGVDLATMETDVECYLGSAENVYATKENLYLTLTRYEYTNKGEGLIYVPNYVVNTSVYRFGLEGGSIVYQEKGKVEGTVLNQFSLDEHEGNLRIATTKGEMWNPDNPSVNNIYILDENLKPLGELEGLAEGERIYSARFAGDRIYMVTYRQVDPFFVIDASDPKAPEVLGELKIPGFSTYMHILDENHVLGFGKETEETEWGVRETGFKISLFDVTDPKEPTEKKKEVIGTSGTYSELQHNHKALMISLTKGIMGFPITVASRTPYATDFDGAYVYDISLDDFSFKGMVTHQEKDKVQLYYGYGINRILYIGDSLYSLSQNRMMVTDLNTMKTTGSLSLKED